MEDIYVFFYNFLDMFVFVIEGLEKYKIDSDDLDVVEKEINQLDNGYFVIFDGYVGIFVVDWCGKKLYIIFEDIICKNFNVLIFEFFD